MTNSAAAASLILSCSPRPRGNCDDAAALFKAALDNSPGMQANSLLYLRDYHVSACTGCDACEQWATSFLETEHDFELSTEQGNTFLGCPLSLSDDSRMIVQALATASNLCIISPIYFYHLPSSLKALLDRLQPFWNLGQKRPSVFAADRPCKVILLGARKRGESLFSGSILTLQYALQPLGFKLFTPLLLHDLDGPKDLAAADEKRQRITAYAKETPVASGQNNGSPSRQ